MSSAEDSSLLSPDSKSMKKLAKKKEKAAKKQRKADKKLAKIAKRRASAAGLETHNVPLPPQRARVALQKGTTAKDKADAQSKVSVFFFFLLPLALLTRLLACVKSDKELFETSKSSRNHKSTKSTLDVRCKDPSCSWRLLWSLKSKYDTWSLSKLDLVHTCTGKEARKRSISTDRVMALSTVVPSFVPVGEGQFGAQSHSDAKQLQIMSRNEDGLALNYKMAKKIITTLAGNPTGTLMRYQVVICFCCCFLQDFFLCMFFFNSFLRFS